MLVQCPLQGDANSALGKTQKNPHHQQYQQMDHLSNTPFLYRQSIFDLRRQNCLSFSKTSPQKLFSNCLVYGLLTSIV